MKSTGLVFDKFNQILTVTVIRKVNEFHFQDKDSEKFFGLIQEQDQGASSCFYSKMK